MKNKSISESQFWENVAVTLAMQRKSFSGLEREAALARCMIPTARTKKLGIRLSTVLKIAAQLNMKPESLLHGRYIFLEGGENEHDKH